MHEAPLTIALTGGIASGKSTLADRFAELGAGVIDADVVARELVLPGQPAFDEVVRTFGKEVLDPRGDLDRAALRRRVFDDPGERRRLEAIVHPKVRAVLFARSRGALEPYVLLVIPLLYENRAQYAWVNRVLVVDAPRALQLERLVARDRVSAALAERILDAQASRAQRLSIADDVIENEGGTAELDAQVAALHRSYLELAGLGKPGF